MSDDRAAPGGDDDFVWITNSIGPVRAEQEPAIRAALAENAAGVHTVAAKIAADPNVRNPVAVLLHAVRQGRHLKTATVQQPKRERDTGTPLQRAHALFTGKMRDLAHTDWDEPERLQFAIDYALDHCGGNVEHQLRLELGVPAWQPNDGPMPRDPAHDTDHRRLMRATHGPQAKERA